MRKKKQTCLYKDLKSLSTEQLDELLQTELKKENPSEGAVLPILDILRQREADDPTELSENITAAWGKYSTHIEGKIKKPTRRWVSAVAAVAAILGVIVLVTPPKAGADSLFDKVILFANNVIQFFDPDGAPAQIPDEYVFTTDNPGLEQLYNQVVETGILDPVVPMWLPEGFELTEIKVVSMPGNTKIVSNFWNGNRAVVITLKISEKTTTSQYEKDDGGYEHYEVGNVNHLIIANEDRWSVAWQIEGAECLIVADIDKEELYKMIKSIYIRSIK